MTTAAHSGEWGDDDFVYSLHTATNHSRASFSEEESSFCEEETSSEYETDLETDSDDDDDEEKAGRVEKSAPSPLDEKKSGPSFQADEKMGTVTSVNSKSRLSRSALIARALERAKKKNAEETKGLVYSPHTASTHSSDSSEYETDYIDETDSEYEADSSDDEIDSDDEEEEEEAVLPSPTEKKAEASLLLDKMSSQLNKMSEARVIGQRSNESLVSDSLDQSKTIDEVDAQQEEDEEANPMSMTELVARALAEAKWKIKEDKDNDFSYSLRTVSNHSVSSLSDEEYEEPFSWEGEKELYCWEEDSNEEADAPEVMKVSPDDSGVEPESENESSEEKAALAETKWKIKAEEDNYNDFVYSLHTASNHSTASSSDEESWEGEKELRSWEEGQEISPEHDADSDEGADSPEVKKASLDDSGVELKSENESSEKKMAPVFDYSAVNKKTEEDEEQNAVEVPIVVDTHAEEAVDTPSADDIAIAALPVTSGTGAVVVSASMASTGTDAEFEALRRELSLPRHGIDAAEEGLEHAALEAELSLSDIGEDIENEEGSSVSGDFVRSEHDNVDDDKDASTETEEEEEQNAVVAPIVVDTHAQEAIDKPSVDGIDIAALADTSGTGAVSVSASMASTGTDAEFETLRRELSLLRHGIDAAEEGLEHAALEAELSLSDIGEDIENEEGSSFNNFIYSEYDNDDDDDDDGNRDASSDTFEKDIDAAEVEQIASQEELDSGAASEEGATLIHPRDLRDEYDQESKVSTKTDLMSAQENGIPKGDRDEADILRQLRQERDELRERADWLAAELLVSKERAAALERERDDMGATIEKMLQRQREDDRMNDALKKKVRELEATLEKTKGDLKVGHRLVVEPIAEERKASRAA